MVIITPITVGVGKTVEIKGSWNRLVKLYLEVVILCPAVSLSLSPVWLELDLGLDIVQVKLVSSVVSHWAFTFWVAC